MERTTHAFRRVSSGRAVVLFQITENRKRETMKHNTQIIAATLIGAALAPASSAGVLVSNLGATTSYTLSVDGPWVRNLTIFAGQFETGSSTTEVFEATARLQNISGYGHARYEGFLYSSSGGEPGALVATFDSTPVLAEGAGVANVSFFSTLGITLDPNTCYWFGVRNILGSYLGWEMTTSDYDYSTDGWTIDDDAMSSSSSAGNSWYNGSGNGRSFKFYPDTSLDLRHLLSSLEVLEFFEVMMQYAQ